MTVRVAMWSGPRNISTALMRSFEARGDCVVVDEPLYAFYLHRTRLDHPMRDAVIASQPTDWRDVVASLTGPVDAAVHYQKHMAHHLLPEVGRDWLGACRHAFLIRDPRAVVASYARARAEVAPEDLGFLQQLELLDAVEALGREPVVVDSDDLLRRPAATLTRLCAALGIPYTHRMLAWPAGTRATDGVWAPHWYARVESSTGFAPWNERTAAVPAALLPVVDAVWPAWERLSALRIRTD